MNRPLATMHPLEQECLSRAAAAAPPGNFVEIGVAEGGSALLILEAMSEKSNLTGIDPCLSYTFAHVEEVMKTFSPPNKPWKLLFCPSVEAAISYEGSVQFLNIDGDHTYDGVKADWISWAPKLLPGSLVAFHDSGGGRFGPTRLVKEILLEGRVEVVEKVQDETILRVL